MIGDIIFSFFRISVLKRVLEEHRNVGEEFVCFFLSKWLWVLKTKEDERKKKKGGVLEGCLLFSLLVFVAGAVLLGCHY